MAMALLFCFAQTKVSALSSNGYVYTVTSSKATITDYTGTGGALTIPSKLGGYTVTAIGDYAFYDGINITSVTIPAGVTTIGKCAFEGCRSLQSVTIPAGVKEVGVAAFYDCINLRTVSLPSGITNIANSTFSGCSNLNSITIPATVTVIGESAFESCAKLASISFPANLTEIGQWAFRNCYGLKSVSIPAYVTSIGGGAFSNCYNLTAINIASGNAAYSSVDGVVFNKNKTVLIDCPEGKSGTFTVPSTVTEIGESGFYGCENLTAITLPNGVTKIGNGAFGSCGINSIVIPGTVTEIDDWAFAFSDNLHYALFLGDAPTIKDYVFSYCASDFKVKYLSGASGFGDSWHGYTAEVFTLGVPQNFSAASAGYNSAAVKWNAVEGATGYVLYRSESSTSGFVKITVTRSTNYTNTGLVTDKTYYYKVSAYLSTAGGNIYSAYSAVKSAKPALSAPAISSATSSSYNSATVKWNAVAGATGYELYRSTNSAAGFAKVTSTTATNYTNSGLTTGSTYYFKVRAYRTVNSVNVYSAYSAVKSAKPALSAPAISSATSGGYNSATVKWNAVAGATGYELYRSTNSASGFAKVTSITATSYTNSGLTTGSVYYYKVRAYRTVNSVNVYGAYSPVKSVKPIPATPASVKAEKASSKSIKLSWKAVSGATGYDIYRAQSASGTYSRVATVSGVSYTNGSLSAGKTYYYKVVAYRLVGNTKIYGAFASPVSLKI